MRNLIFALALVASIAQAQYQPWDTVGIATGADLDVAVPVPYGQTRSYRAWSSDGSLNWGWVEMDKSGDWRQWDNERGFRWGRLEVEQ